MIKNIKKLFCNHRFVMYKDNLPFYVSCGDEHQDRRSIRYYLVCGKCNKEIEVIKRWSSDDIK